MPITFPCPSCGKTLSVPATAVGKSARCPECKILTPVTATSGEQPPPPPPAPASANSTEGKKSEESEAPDKERIRKRGKSKKQKDANATGLVAIIGVLLGLGALGAVTVIIAAVYVLKSDEPASAPAVASAPAPGPAASATTQEHKPVAESPPPKVAFAGPESSNLSSIQTDKPSAPFTVRGECEMAAIFTADFKAAKNTHVCVRLRQGNPFASILCYAARDSEEGKRLTQLFGNGERRVMTVECELGHESTKVAKLIRIVEFFTSMGPAATGPGLGYIDPTNASPSFWLSLLGESTGSRASMARERLKALGATAMPEMRRVLFDSDPRVRVALASLLGEMGENANVAIDDLALSLGDDEASVRAAAARSLGKLGAAAHAALLPLVIASADSDASASAAAT